MIDPVNCVNYDNKGNYLVSSSSDLSIKLWDLNQGFCVKTLIGHQSLILCIKLLVNDILVSGSFDKTIKVNDFCNRKILVIL
jgi:platelet-activating factor acetylhydrolase IB subunit alpha